MSKRIITLLSVLGVLSSHAQFVLDLHSGKLTREMTSTVPKREIEKLEDGYKVTYIFEKVIIQPDELFPETVFLKMDGFGMNDTSGDPCTLLRNDLIAVPSGCNAKVEVTDSAYRDFSYELTPARQPLLDSDNEIYTRQNVFLIKPYEGFKPTNIVLSSGTQYYRGHSLFHMTVFPIQYNYKTKTVRAYTSITYKISFIPVRAESTYNRIELRHLSREDKFLTNNVIDGWQEEADGTRTGSTAQSDVRDYLILSTNAYSAAAKRFAGWKRLMGFNVHVILRDDWTCTSVKSTVTDAYTNMSALYYLLIIGDHNDVPAEQSSTIHPHVTDFYYGCMDDDYIPEIYCGRLSVSTSDEAVNVVEKIIAYEQSPPTNSNFFNKGLHCAYFEDDNNDGYEDRRFTQTSEDILTYVMSKDKSIQRVYTTPSDVTPYNWNDPDFSSGEPIPPELLRPGFSWNGDSADIKNAIDNGTFYVLHRDHGEVGRWVEPSFTQQDISNLSNGNLLPVVFSINCSTGKFNEYCFAESFLRKSNGGCVGIFAPTADSYSGYNDAFVTGMFDAIWPNPGLSINIPDQSSIFSTTPYPTYTLGQIKEQGFIRLTETYVLNIYALYTKEIYHCFGDPSMKIYTETPTAFTDVSIVRNESSISVNLGSNDLARITACNPATGEVQSYIGNSAIVTTLNPKETIICVSAHNRIPFIQTPDVLYIQNTNITGTLDETHDMIKVGNHVTTIMETGDVTTSSADITLRANEVVLDSGTEISVGSSLKIINP